MTTQYVKQRIIVLSELIAFQQIYVIYFVYKCDYNSEGFVVSFVNNKSIEGSDDMPRMIVIPPRTENAVKKLRVAAYCRVSTNHADQENSYETQVRYFSELFDNSSTHQLVGIYADEGITGTSLDSRVSFIKLLEDCRHGRIDRIITKSISRFARNTMDCLKCIRELNDLGITIIFEKENIDTARMSDEMMVTIMGGLAQEESHSISRNVLWSIQKKMASGTYRHARVPYGYKKNEKTGSLIIDPRKAKIVKRIFSMYLSGTGTTSIAVKLNNEGIASPTGVKWNGVTICKMLWQKTYSEFMGPQFQINRGQKPKYYIQNSHPAIIDKETFEQAAMRLKENKTINTETKELLFRKKLICGQCGHMYTLKPGRIINWQCSHKYNTTKRCSNAEISDKALHIALEALCDKLHINGRIILGRCIDHLTRLESLKPGGTLSIANTYTQIAELKEQKHRLTVLRTKGHISDEKFMLMESEVERSIAELNGDIERLSQEKDTAIDDIRLIYETVKEYDGTIEYRERILSELVERIRITGSEIRFELIGGLSFTERNGAYEN